MQKTTDLNRLTLATANNKAFIIADIYGAASLEFQIKPTRKKGHKTANAEDARAMALRIVTVFQSLEFLRAS